MGLYSKMQLFLCVLSTLVATAIGKFDCRRDSSMCLHGSNCNDVDGICQCSVLYSGVDCSIVEAEKEQSLCGSSPCSNGATCSSDSSTYKCHCTENFFGTNCETSRYIITCTSTPTPQMTLRLTPQVPSFTGKIFVEGKAKTTACHMTLVSGTTQTYELTLTHTHATCGNAVHNASTDSHTRKFYVLFASDSIVLTSDEVVTAVCDDTQSTAASSQLGITDIDSILSPVGVDMSIKDEDVDLTLTASGSPISSSVSLGDDITATIEMTAAGLPKFVALRVEGCVASNTMAGGDFKSVRFINSSCPSSDVDNVMIQKPSKVSDTKVTFIYDAFKFTNQDAVSVTCTVKMCTEKSTCAAVQCGGETQPYSGNGRKKRGLQSDIITKRTVRTTYRVLTSGVQGNTSSTPVPGALGSNRGSDVTVGFWTVGSAIVLALCFGNDASP
ncbi:EGF-like domain-containing protein 1 isoform X1 [Haliotis rufescens]|uniref:EGF-like domain-containing protein 1 isoform X1 n=2 Tax=Haliotis rufescens TaxID=6454 RepID=UPI00201E9152|nr:EGF-like domain-containing protein 1 isoform X1 [Haliotis rufescens]